MHVGLCVKCLLLSSISDFMTIQEILYFIDLAARYNSLLMTNLTRFFSLLLHLSTCFEHHSAHHQEIELY